MNTLRAIAKNAVIVLMLVTTPLAQARAVFVCSMMNRAMLEQCCCGDAHERTRAHDADPTACCVVSLEIHEVGIAANAVSSDHGVKRLSDHSPDLATASLAPTPIAATFEPSVRPTPFDSVADSPTRLYLLTARLRL